jgi:hypothetical protein
MTDWTGWIAVGGGALLIGNFLVELRETTTDEGIKSLNIDENQTDRTPQSVVILGIEEE